MLSTRYLAIFLGSGGYGRSDRGEVIVYFSANFKFTEKFTKVHLSVNFGSGGNSAFFGQLFFGEILTYLTE